jgi:hypothetical protein
MPIDFYRWDNIATNTLLYPKLLHGPPRHSHSIILVNDNALICRRKLFLHAVKNRCTIHQKVQLLI